MVKRFERTNSRCVSLSKDRLTLASALTLWLCITALPVAAQQRSCDQEAWAWIGVDAFHCPGGTCAFRGSSEDSLQFEFSAEPWLRAIAPDGPAADVLKEGDVLVAVNGLLITTASGGRELGHLEQGQRARLTVRRADQLLDLEVDPEDHCGGPLMLIGTSLLELPSARQRSFTVTPRTTGDGTMIDFTVPKRTRGTALDMSLGMKVRCADCVMRRDDRRWLVDTYPVIESVVGDGVADEAGLRAGDTLLEISGRDLRSRRGGELLFSPPRGDFKIRYQRGNEDRTALINRRVIDQRIRIQSDRVERVNVQIHRGKDGWSPEVLGALAAWWSDLRSRGADEIDASLSIPGMAQRWIASGDSWGIASLGLLFETRNGQFFVLRPSGDELQMRLLDKPVISEVIAGGPGEDAGFEVGDVLVEINGHPILGSNGSARFLYPKTDKPVTFQFLRDGETKRTTLVPKETP